MGFWKYIIRFSENTLETAASSFDDVDDIALPTIGFFLSLFLLFIFYLSNLHPLQFFVIQSNLVTSGHIHAYV